MKRSFFAAMALAITLAIAACGDGTQSDVEATLADLAAAWNAGDAQTLEGMYAENAVVVSADGTSWEGRNAIIQELVPLMGSEGFQVRLRSTIEADGGVGRMLAAATSDFSLNDGTEGFVVSVFTLNANTMEIIEQRDFALTR